MVKLLDQSQYAPGPFNPTNGFWCASHRAKLPVETTHKPGEFVLRGCPICAREREEVEVIRYHVRAVQKGMLPPRFMAMARTFNTRFLPR